ncbi:50S ribosomal protein L25 [Buchnera aphidicola (Cinara kochiana kochiana)]|uniref:50S ribosomal protein L25 n=1 Tax=Buchnera aphidicola (Cinara kochiana kochiana) TaxID=2518976 RepID=A0A451D5F2_9GAMM|nr:50S ribosomal protein L25 [Buchnera aphidicola]VFP81013.1 50S ribosomal protein L25 [Buchnera aphidicola (Cinara kochiana kochiana)]
MITLNAIYRDKKGTSNSRYVRKVHHKMPGIIYGKKFLKQELLILLEHDIVFNLQKNSNFFSKTLSIILDKKKFLVILKDIQYHAFKSILLHIDFLCVNNII